MNLLVIFCFFLSGMTSLIYEVVWTRYLISIFGSSNYSVSTVLTAFMTGLALGSFLAAKLSKRLSSRSPLLMYIVIETAIGLFAMASPELFSLLKNYSLSILPAESYLNADSGLYIKFFLSFLLMVLPTALMGATFPILSLYFAGNGLGVKKWVGRLYAVNTLGAVVGTFLAGFVLLHTLGVDNTIRLGAVINLAIGVLLWFLIKNKPAEDEVRGRGRTPRETKKQAPGPQPLETGAGLANKLLLLFAVSGFLSLGYEVIWVRLLTQVVGGSTYAFSMILISFLFGIAGGSWVISRWIKEGAISPALFGWLLAGIGVFGYFFVPLMSSLPGIMLAAFRWFPDSFYSIVLFQFALVNCVVLPAAFLMGATMPVVISLVKEHRPGISDCVGTAYFYNTLGAIFGSFFMGFVFIPHLGSLLSLKLAIAANLVIGTGLLIFLEKFYPTKGKKKSPRLAYLLPLLLLIPLVAQTWPKGALDVSVSIYGPELALQKGKTVIGDQLFHSEGVNATVSIRQAYDHITLHINGKTDASNGKDMATQLLLGLLPHLAAPEQEKALVIGLGSGVTARVLAEAHPSREVWVSEIEPAVVEASKFFYVENHSLHEKKNARFVVNDARNFLMDSGRKFGLITSEPSNPWLMGISNLFTDDFYRLVKKNLEPDGVFVQWFHLYGMDPENYKMVLKTLASVFPSIQLWESGFGDILFVCSNNPVRWDFSSLKKMEQLDLKSYKKLKDVLFIDNPGDLWAYFKGAYQAGVFDFPGVPINSDQWPILEFKAPLDLYKDTLAENRGVTHKLFANATGQENVGYPLFPPQDGKQKELAPGIIRTKAMKLLSYKLVNEAGRLLPGYPKDWEALDLPRAGLAYEKEEYSRVIYYLGKYLSKPVNHNEELLLLGQAGLKSKDFSITMQCIEKLNDEKYEMDNSEIERLGMLWKGVGAVDRAYGLLRERVKSAPSYRLLFLMGNLMAAQGKLDLAESHVRESLKANPHSGSSLMLLGNILWAQGKKEEAKPFYKMCLENWEGSEKAAQRLRE